MDSILKTEIWQQFGASIDMLADAINRCPDHLWTTTLWKDPDDPAYGQFWFVAYHTLYWLDLYLSGASREEFVPPAPFKPRGLPEKPYTKDQICAYLDHCRRKCQSTIEALTDEQARRRCRYDWIEASFREMLIYNMRHVQEHTAQLNLTLGQHGIAVNDWITQAL